MNISGNAKLAAVLGWPVAHSLSPRLHNFWLQEYGIDGVFVPLPVAPEHFAQTLRVLSHAGFAGINATVPHKEAALAAVDEADEIARRIGAVNTVVFRDDGSLFGTNTDGAGFLAHLRDQAPSFEPAARPAVVIGAGGAARAITMALVDAGTPEIRICNRTLARAEILALGLGPGARVINWIDRAGALDGAGIVVNTTTQGMIGQEPLDLDLDPLPREAVVYDIVYNPLETPLMESARARGNLVLGGLGMLLHQAVPGFAAWFGIEPEVSPGLIAHVTQGLA
jgi:shikimate dehydrogenase